MFFISISKYIYTHKDFCKYLTPNQMLGLEENKMRNHPQVTTGLQKHYNTNMNRCNIQKLSSINYFQVQSADGILRM